MNHTSPIMSVSDPEPDANVIAVDSKATKKRKHGASAGTEDELEIDINLPEPPSKKARRKEKKEKDKKMKAKETANSESSAVKPATESEEAIAKATQKKGDFGIWIGNLPFSATPDKLREFFQDKGDIDSADISRLNMPGFSEEKAKAQANTAVKVSQNKGFAYVDFTSKEVQEKALALSEKLLVGRAVLIKDAKSFAGRPQKKAGEDSGAKASGKEPSKKVFVGNLGFDVTKEDLTELLGKAGRIADCFLATFEDSGKCKGYGWIRFGTIEAAQAAVRGFVFEEPEEADDEEGDEEEQAAKKSKRGRKIYINKVQGRSLRCEFAEDAQTRYKKRYGKDAPPKKTSSDPDDDLLEPAETEPRQTKKVHEKKRSRNMDKEQRRDERRKKHDARLIAPGKALANSQRASAAIVQGAGKKISFDE